MIVMKKICFKNFYFLFKIFICLSALSALVSKSYSQNFGVTDASALVPNYLVQIHLNNNSGTLLQLTNSLSGSGPTNGLIFNSTNTGVFNIRICNQENGYLSFGTNNTERMRIAASGYIGIGTSSPGNQLHVSATTDPLRLDGLQTLSAGNDVLLVDANGVVFKKTFIQTNDWSTTGNSGTVVNTNYLGTNDSINFMLKVFSHPAGILDLGEGNTSYGIWSLPGYISGSYNTAIGFSALRSNTTGSENTATGNSALFSNTTGKGNTAFGYLSLFSNADGASNTAVGHRALYSNTNGWGNTATGDSALFSNISGAGNTANGFQALFSNTGGFVNTATGYGALFSNISGSGNTANGYFALHSNIDGSGNTAVGLGALYANISAQDNTAMGFGSLSTNTTGDENTAYGSTSLEMNTTGGKNSAFGRATLDSNITGNYNTASGYHALHTNFTGNNNTALGTYTLHSNTSGSFNTAVGSNAMHGDYGAVNSGNENLSLGAFSLESIKTGSSNTGVGAYALYKLVSGNANTALGWYAGNYVTGDSNIIIGINDTKKPELSGKMNIIIGNHLNAPVSTGNYQLNIGNLLFGTNLNGYETVLSSGNIGVGITTPTNKLHVHAASDPLRLDGLQTNSTDNEILVSTSTGIIQKRDFPDILSVSGWTLNGNSATNPASQFIGTTDNQPLVFRTNSNEYMRLGTSGDLGIGTASPTLKVDVNGDFGYRENTLAASIGANDNINTGGFSFIKITASGAFSIDGIAGGYDGKIVTLYNSTSYNMTITNSGSSVTNDNINTLSGSNITTAGQGTVTLQYSASDHSWIVIAIRD